MLKISTISVKTKQKKSLQIWFSEQEKKAADLYRKCLDLQFEHASQGRKLHTAFDLAKIFRDYPLGSDYKDRIYERTADSTQKWIKSESLRYQIYWDHKTKKKKTRRKTTTSKKNQKLQENKGLEKYPYLKNVTHEIEQHKDYKKHIAHLARKQKIIGKPRKRKTCSLAFSIRKNRQSTIHIKKNKIECVLPKFKEKIYGKYNLLPTSSNYQFKLATLKKDRCGTLWVKLTFEENVVPVHPVQNSDQDKENIVVGVDMGLKTTRTAVAVNEVSKEIVEIYSPKRQRFFDLGYNALVWASNKDKRHLPFVHRKIVRRRRDSIDKDIIKILSMGKSFKFGKPNSAFLFSGRLARSAADAANSMFLTRFAKHAELAGKESGEVDESYTSVTCRKCGDQRPMPLHVRTFECFTCAHEEDRDINSAYQIAFRDFLHDDHTQNIEGKIKTKNGVLSHREMKPVELFQQGDFQAQTPSQAAIFRSRWGRAD